MARNGAVIESMNSVSSWTFSRNATPKAAQASNVWVRRQ